MSHEDSRREFQAEGRARAKALRLGEASMAEKRGCGRGKHKMKVSFTGRILAFKQNELGGYQRWPEVI